MVVQTHTDTSKRTSYSITAGVLDDYIEMLKHKKVDCLACAVLTQHRDRIILHGKSPEEQVEICGQLADVRADFVQPVPTYESYVTKNYPVDLAEKILASSDPAKVTRLNTLISEYNAVLQNVNKVNKLCPEEKITLKHIIHTAIALCKRNNLN